MPSYTYGLAFADSPCLWLNYIPYLKKKRKEPGDEYDRQLNEIYATLKEYKERNKYDDGIW